jgi:S-adenosyl-L-methionine hydrolase (adenosine-forming)
MDTICTKSRGSVVSIITLTTDFGAKDGYVAQMKGVILGICPQARLVDVTHDIQPYSLIGGALVLKGVNRYFREGTIHVGVVDPGVGSARRCIALKMDNRFFVGPDNGLFSLIFESAPEWEAREITNPACLLPTPHPTFHGRDIFAPTAAHLCAGKPFDSVGPLIDDPVSLGLPGALHTPDGIHGEIIYIDRFGNLTSNIPAEMLTRNVRSVEAGNARIAGIHRFFGEVPEGEPVALINSFGFLEIAVNKRDAARELALGTGEPVKVLW